LANSGNAITVGYKQLPRAHEWLLTLIFYAAIALVIMIWLWPLTRDLRALERATANFGNRHWQFDARVSPRSQVWSLAQTFKKREFRKRIGTGCSNRSCNCATPAKPSAALALA
jgi:hypothetical protein